MRRLSPTHLLFGALLVGALFGYWWRKRKEPAITGLGALDAVARYRMQPKSLASAGKPFFDSVPVSVNAVKILDLAGSVQKQRVEITTDQTILLSNSPSIEVTGVGYRVESGRSYSLGVLGPGAKIWAVRAVGASDATVGIMRRDA